MNWWFSFVLLWFSFKPGINAQSADTDTNPCLVQEEDPVPALVPSLLRVAVLLACLHLGILAVEPPTSSGSAREEGLPSHPDCFLPHTSRLVIEVGARMPVLWRLPFFGGGSTGQHGFFGNCPLYQHSFSFSSIPNSTMGGGCIPQASRPMYAPMAPDGPSRPIREKDLEEMPTGLYFAAMNFTVHAVMYFYYFLSGGKFVCVCFVGGWGRGGESMLFLLIVKGTRRVCVLRAVSQRSQHEGEAP